MGGERIVCLSLGMGDKAEGWVAAIASSYPACHVADIIYPAKIYAENKIARM
jgi:hypothetical protein